MIDELYKKSRYYDAGQPTFLVHFFQFLSISHATQKIGLNRKKTKTVRVFS